MQLFGRKRLEAAAALEHLGVLLRQDASREVDGGFGELAEIFGGDVVAPASRLDPAAEADQEHGAAAIIERIMRLAIGVGLALGRSLAQRIEAGDRRTGLCDRRQGIELEHVPITGGGEVLRQPFGFRPQRIEIAERADRPHQIERRSKPAQRDAQLMHAFRIAPVLGGRQRLKQMEEAGAQDRREGLVECDRRIEAKFSRASRRGRLVGGKIKAARRLGTDRRLHRTPCSASRSATS